MQRSSEKARPEEEYLTLDRSLFDYYVSNLIGKYKARNFGQRDAYGWRKKPKITFTVQLRPELIEKIRDAAYWTEDMTMSKMSEYAFIFWLAYQEKQRGEPFPPRKGKLKEGRPRKSTMEDKIDIAIIKSSKDNEDKSQLVLLTLKQTADYLNISREQAYKMVKSGEIPEVRIGKNIRCKVEDLDEYIKKNTTRKRSRIES